jgi:ureidoglycolate hydrolase
MSALPTMQKLASQLITPENFQAYGQVIYAIGDRNIFDQEDAQLNLQNGSPRFYIMRLQEKGRKFHQITRHIKCTQCLGSLDGKDWLMAVCPPNNDLHKPVLSEIPGNCFINLSVGTWHAGPYFDHEFVDFYNLELSDTNIVDHFSYNFLKSDNLAFEII